MKIKHKYLIILIILILILGIFYSQNKVQTRDQSQIENKARSFLKHQISNDNDRKSGSSDKKSIFLSEISQPQHDPEVYKTSGFSFSGVGISAKIRNSKGDIVLDSNAHKMITNMVENSSANYAKINFSNSSITEIYSLPEFKKIAETSEDSIIWRWLTENKLLGIKNSSSGDCGNCAEGKIHQITQLYVYDLKRMSQKRVHLPQKFLRHFEILEIIPNSTIKLIDSAEKEHWFKIEEQMF